MTKKKTKQTQEKHHSKKVSTDSKSQQLQKQKIDVIGSKIAKKHRIAKSSHVSQMKNNKLNFKKIDQLSHSDEQLQKSEYEVPKKPKRKISKKKKGKSSKVNSKSKNSGVKLQRGYKFCQNCQTVLNIHKYVCTQCGFVHNMKKHKFDVMKNLSKATPKIVKSIIQSNEFNTINLSIVQQSTCFESSFDMKSLLLQKNQQHLIGSTNKISQEEVKKMKYQGKHDKVNNNQSQLINQKGDKKAQNKIIFNKLNITKSNEFSTKINDQTEKPKNNNQFDKTREQFSIYKSQYPILCMQPLQVFKNQQNTNKSHQLLLFTESVSKKQFFPLQTYSWDILISNGHQMKVQNQNVEMINDQFIDKKQFLRRQQLKQKRLKQEQEKAKLQKLRQNNILTEKALSLGNYHKIGALYQGQTILNVMSLEKPAIKTKKQQNTSNKQQMIPQQTIKRRSSARSSKSVKQKSGLVENKKIQDHKIVQQNDEYNVFRIGITEHTQMIRSVRNKIAILTGKKSILLLNIDSNFDNNVLQQNINQQQETKQNEFLWLESKDFDHQNNLFTNKNNNQNENSINKRYLTSISLSKDGSTKTSDDQFTVIEWMKFYQSSSAQSLIKNDKKNQDSYLITGTLFGHIFIYRVSAQNNYDTYRTIIGAHFEMINCLSQCPLNINGSGLFASGSYDGSVKIWQVNHTSVISQFQVSNRKIQSIHWDSGAKFLLIVRDEGLQNCYLACFYSVNNRIELRMMLSDTIDFRLIRNGLMFDNSCSPLVSFGLNSKLVLMLNCRNGFLKVLESEELRKTSLKRKKSKKNYQQLIYHNYWIRMGESKLSAIQQSSQTNNMIQLYSQPQKYPQIIQMKSNCTDYLNYTYAAKVQLQQTYDYQQILQKNQSIISNQLQNHNHKEDSESSQNNQRPTQTKPIKNTQNNKQLKNKTYTQSQPPPIRKSLRVRKPNIQYNFIQQQEEEESKHSLQSQSQQNNKHKPIHKKNKNKNQHESDNDQDFSKSSSQSSQEIDNQSQQQSHNHKKQKLNHQIINQTKNQPKQEQNHSNKTQMRKNLRSKKQQKQQNNNSQAQQILYKLFWQENHQQSLVKKKQHYPTNKFPKFSAITSFVSINQESKEVEKQKKQQKQVNQKNIKSKTQNKALIVEENLQQQRSLSENSDIQPKKSKDKQKRRQNVQEQHQKKDPQNQVKQDETHQQLQNKSEYLTSFISSYNGELIRVRIKIQGYHQVIEAKQTNQDFDQQSD